MADMPTGPLTFLFTDIQGSVRLWEHCPDAMRDALVRHDAILRRNIEAGGGRVFKTVGDCFFAVFASAPAALQAACAIQRALRDEPWGDVGPLRVRASLYSGSAVERGGDYFGPTLNRAERLLAAAHGGQIILAQMTADLLRDTLPSDVTLVDLGARRLKDLAGPERVFQVLTPDLPSEFPPLRTLDARPVRLPAQITPFVGRESEVAQVCALLRRPDVRLVTLIGPGGTGKTRLALQAAANMADEYEHGVNFVSLSPLSDPGMVASAIAHGLGAQESPGQPLLETVKDHLRDQELLLVLDNFEHVMVAAPLVGELLLAARRCKILVTSREILRVYGEHDYAVPPLALPDLEQRPTLEQLRDCAAVALFVQRAQAVQAGFELTPENARVVADICVRLDGLPLAIELAAAHIRLFAPHEMLHRLADRFTLLTGGSRDMPARQQTLRGAFRWSYELLDPGERRLFARLGVFVGGCTIGAAETVGNADGDVQPDVPAVLAALVDKSLLQPRKGGPGESGFIMLETLRDYALEMLIEAGEAARVWRRHAEYYLQFAEAAEPELRGSRQSVWLNRLEREHDNLRAAMGWALQHGQVDKALRLGGALFNFWYWRSHLNEGRMWLEGALASALGSASPPAVRAKALQGAGVLATVQGDYRRAQTCLEGSLELGRELGDRRGIAFALIALGSMNYNLGNLDLAAHYLEQGLAVCRELGDRWALASALNNLGELARCRGDYAAAQACYSESLTLRRELNNRIGIAVSLHNLGHVAHRSGDDGQAGALFAEALLISRELGDVQCIAENLTGLAGVFATQGQPDRALRLFGAAEALLESIGARLDPADRVERDRNMAIAQRGSLDKASQSWWSEGRGMTCLQAAEYALESLSDA